MDDDQLDARDDELLVGGDADVEPEQGAAPPGMVATGDLLADIDLRPDPERAGRWSTVLPEAWNVFYVFGGVTMATALRAAQRAVDRVDLVPLSAHATFCAPVPAGPVTVDAEILRSGRSAAQVAADTDAEWILQHVVVQHAGDGDAVGTAELWDDQRRLVAFATQRARLRPFAPPSAPQ